jgi:hypothetical protein
MYSAAVQLKAAPDLSRCSIGNSRVDSCLVILGGNLMTDLALENFAIGSDT